MSMNENEIETPTNEEVEAIETWLAKPAKPVDTFEMLTTWLGMSEEKARSVCSAASESSNPRLTISLAITERLMELG